MTLMGDLPFGNQRATSRCRKHWSAGIQTFVTPTRSAINLTRRRSH